MITQEELDKKLLTTKPLKYFDSMPVSVENVLNQLETWGVSNPSEGVSGTLLTQPSQPLEIFEMQTFDTTPFFKNFRNIHWLQQNVLVPCIGGFRPACRLQTKYVPPSIDFSVIPTSLRNIEVNLVPWNLFVRGDVVLQVINDSERGKKCTKRAHEEEWNCETIPDSADLLTDSVNTFIADDEDLTFVNGLNLSFNRVSPNNNVDSSATWRSEGVWDWIVSLVNIFLTGSCRTRGGIDAVAEYNWRGNTRSQNRHFNIQLRLPIQGDLVYIWET